MRQICVFVALALLVLIGCTRQASSTQDVVASQTLPLRLETAHLHNVYRIHDRVISGGEPDGEAAFRELCQMGIRTVISVDGARPQVDVARKFGLRYVHLPHGYDGISERRARELAKAVRDLPGPVYIHCHHGRHRSPTAAAVACVGIGILEPAAAITVLQVAGTSERYRGLYESASGARRFDAALLDAMEAEFPAAADIPAAADAMVAIGHTLDNLKIIEKAGWKPSLEHPDLDPAHEALLLREHFTEVLRMEEIGEQPAEYQQMLRESESAAIALETALRNRTDRQRPPAKIISKSFASISDNCGACHRQFRDVPLSAKQQPSR